MSDPRYVNIGRPQHRLVEERGELMQAICKGERFRWFSHHPERPGTTNLDELLAEIQEVSNARDRLEGFLFQ